MQDPGPEHLSSGQLAHWPLVKVKCRRVHPSGCHKDGFPLGLSQKPFVRVPWIASSLLAAWLLARKGTSTPPFSWSLRFGASNGIILWGQSRWLVGGLNFVSRRHIVTSVCGGICGVNEMKYALGISPNAYFNLSSRGLTFQNTQFCSLWKLITGLFHC